MAALFLACRIRFALISLDFSRQTNVISLVVLCGMDIAFLIGHAQDKEN